MPQLPLLIPRINNIEGGLKLMGRITIKIKYNPVTRRQLKEGFSMANRQKSIIQHWEWIQGRNQSTTKGTSCINLSGQRITLVLKIGKDVCLQAGSE